jgi:hypothetical protein
MLLNAELGSVPWLEVNLDQAHARERSRFAVVDICAKRKETLKGIRNVRFDLLLEACRCRNVATTTTGMSILGNRSTGILAVLTTATRDTISKA